MNAPQKVELIEVGENLTGAQQIDAHRSHAMTTAAQPATPTMMLAMAVERGASLEYIEKLMALQERWEANEARKAFTVAMTDFKAEPLEIFKRKAVGYATKEGDFVGYKHAELSDVADVVVPAMARHGLSHRWDVKQESARVIVTCTVTHRLGHSESVTMDAGPDDSGKKNKIQQIASAVTYLQRYTLLAAAGLATKSEVDDDGCNAEDHNAEPLEVWSGRAALARSLDELSLVSKDGAKHFKGAGNVDAYKLFAQAVMDRGAALRAAGATQ